jgi:hypothetical protein
MLFPNRWNATRAVGFLFYFGSAISCLLWWLRARRYPRSYPESSRLALFLAVIESLFCLDMLLEWRLEVHQFFVNLFLENHVYGERHGLQVGLLGALFLLLIASLGMVLRRFRARKGASLAIGGVFLSLTLYAMEIISMHETDRGLYHLVSGVMVIAYLWALACVLTLLGAIMDARSGAGRI